MKKQIFLKGMIFFTVIFLIGCTNIKKTQMEDSPNTEPQYNASFVINSKVYIISRDGECWDDVTPKDAKGISNVFFLGSGDGWAVGSDNNHESTLIYRTTDKGKNWDVSHIDIPGYSSYISFANENNGWVLLKWEGAMMKEQVHVIQTKDGGITWNLASKITTENVKKQGSIPFTGIKTGITFLNDKQGWITLEQPTIGQPYLIFTKDGGLTWETNTLTISQSYNNYLKSTAGPIFFSEKNGILQMRVYDSSKNTKELMFYTTKDGGENWTASSELIHSSSKGFYLWSFYNSMQGYITDGYTLYSTRDAGNSWNSINTSMNISAIQKMFFFNDKLGWIISQTGNYKTTNGGAKWQKTE